MGAANALAAYRLYAGKVPPVSMIVLAYMALVTLDKDGEPSWWEGHEMLAARCLGRAEPVSDADLRAIRRAITPLFTAGAITVARHSSGHGAKKVTVRYRLWLDHPAPDEKRPTPKLCTGRKTSYAEAGVGRKVVVAQDEKRPTKEEEEELKQEQDITGVPAVNTTLEGARAGARATGNPDFAATGRPSPRTADETEAERRRWHDALNEWMRQHPGAAS